MITKETFNVVAEVISAEKGEWLRGSGAIPPAIITLEGRLAHAFTANNPAFKAEAFYKACEVRK